MAQPSHRDRQQRHPDDEHVHPVPGIVEERAAYWYVVALRKLQEAERG